MRHQIRSTQKYAGVSDESMQVAVLALNWGEAAAPHGAAMAAVAGVAA